MSFEVFDTFAEKYEEWYRKNTILAENEVRLLKRFYFGYPSLEIGVGTGFFAYHLRIDLGVDLALNALRIAKRRVEVIAANASMLPFKDKSIDSSLLAVTLCFLERPEEAVEELKRVMKPYGKAIACIVPKESTWGKYYEAKESVFYKVAHFFTVMEVIDLFKSKGFSYVKALGTLSFKPWQNPIVEEPKAWAYGYDLGFVCIEFMI
ncbi:MAG: class I SAM-dependent methyltransferase [Caldisphaeraceae archaeon]|nr:class I SAM-dependent methyltransferase [Caldisphaeraceae archaeon]MEB3692195.1 class I SAM-dependent methyltransferase [Caldisphaeraceae archaeon]MEB3797978.1 class I SAM-dependent methyltransferase [Caldisphaeraceae archaeon]